MKIHRLLILVLAAALVACGSGAGAGAGDDVAPSYEFETVDVDGVPTVRSISGSQWGAEAVLREELSIGVLEGPEEYSFAGVFGIWPTADKVFVADMRLPAVRAYDLDGTYLFDVGAPGQGPGEYERAASVQTLPDGRIVVHDGSKLVVYDAAGNHLENWTGSSGGGFRMISPNMVTVTAAGDVYVRKPIMPEGGGFSIGDMQWAMQQMGSEGEVGEPVMAPDYEYERPTIELNMGGGTAMIPAPFSASEQFVMMPDGGFVAGVSTEYAFDIHRPDGTRLGVRSYQPRVPVNPDELRIQQSQFRIVVNGSSPSPAEMGDADDLPEFRPAYDQLSVSRDGRIMVLRSGATTVKEACLDPNLTADDIRSMDCVDGKRWIDVFGTDGMFQGSFELPDGAEASSVHLQDDTLWTSVQDESGTITVRRYRVVVPGTEIT